jgi:hypothetical protein
LRSALSFSAECFEPLMKRFAEYAPCETGKQAREQALERFFRMDAGASRLGFQEPPMEGSDAEGSPPGPTNGPLALDVHERGRDC